MTFSILHLKETSKSKDFNAYKAICFPQFSGFPIAIITSYSFFEIIVNKVINPKHFSFSESIRKNLPSQFK